MDKKVAGIGLVGAGTVGGGVIKLLLQKAGELSAKAGIKVELMRVADLKAERATSLGVAADRVSSTYQAVLDDPKVDIVIELMGGTKTAYDVVSGALQRGKCVVTANKALLAERGVPLFQLSREKNIPLAFEAAVCGAIPIIRGIRDGLVACRIESLLGIVNGTCNFILTKMLGEGSAYDAALAEAQKLGYAEADPTLDVSGGDSAHKLALLCALGFSTWPDYPKIHMEGINNLQIGDMMAAREMGYVTKLLAVARPAKGKLFLSVHPALLAANHPLANVNGSMNAVSIVSDAALESVFHGRGAGELPTASAVLSDVIEIARGMAKGVTSPNWLPSSSNQYTLGDMADYECRYLLRFTVADRHGVLGNLATILGDHEVSIASVVQKEAYGQGVPVVILTHKAREGNVHAAMEKIGKLGFIAAPTSLIRVEE